MHVHLELFCGASGDMLLGALVDAGVPLETLQQAVAGLGLGGIQLSARRVDQRGIAATKVDVTTRTEHHHRHLPDIEQIINAGALSTSVQTRSISVFRTLAEAEAQVHDMPVASVHFHEVGALDAIADVVGVVAGLEFLGVSSISCRALPFSHGTVHCAHGLLPVPAPAVLRLAEGLPTEPLDVQGETLTPTAAALLRTVVTDWGDAPPMLVHKHGYGAGSKSFPRANVLRLILGERQRETDTEHLALLETNIDDMNPEWLPAVLDRLLSAGARDAWLTPVIMKKGRPAHTLSTLADPAAIPALRNILYAHTTSLGIREARVDRHHLARETITVDTAWGPVRVKVATLPDGERRGAPEYEDCRRISEARDVSLAVLYEAALAAWHSS
ncbi:MAG: nickel pincer cofactor biosynthesis protein LarC [Gammaproteobacteria bacterium]|nr:nickel pincer cofactor biosynthesis protein LarC [Gammaproteobacteria bacterium]